MMLLCSASMSTAISGYIAELNRGREKIVETTMWTTLVIGSVIFYLLEGFLRGTLGSGVQAAEMPLIGGTLSTITLTIVPALVTGSICGGVACLLPEIVEERPPPQPKALPKITPDVWPGYEKRCLKCGNAMPFDSIYCSFCGATLRRAGAPEVKFCRYCGNRIYFIGEFCPDCGREINLISKPKVYVSE